MVKKFILFLLIIFLLMGCSYSVYTNAYPHLKRVQLMAFDNKSTEFALGDIVYNRLSRDFRDDGRLRLVTQQPDCQVEGSIVSYSEKIYAYDTANNIQDYIVTITFRLSFTDLTNNNVIYDNEKRDIVIEEKYGNSDESTSRFKTKDEAITEICDKCFKLIMQNTLETW